MCSWLHSCIIELPLDLVLFVTEAFSRCIVCGLIMAKTGGTQEPSTLARIISHIIIRDICLLGNHDHHNTHRWKE